MCWSIPISQPKSLSPDKPLSNLTLILQFHFLLHADDCNRLKELNGDWHEFESKALRKENERKSQEARRAARSEEYEKEKAKRKAGAPAEDRDAKRPRPSSGQGGLGSK